MRLECRGAAASAGVAARLTAPGVVKLTEATATSLAAAPCSPSNRKRGAARPRSVACTSASTANVKASPGEPGDVADGAEEKAPVVPVHHGCRHLMPGRHLRRDRRAGQPVERDRQANRGCRQGEQGRNSARERCRTARQPPETAARSVPGHVPGPVTPVTKEATAEPVEVNVSMPISDNTRVGWVTVTVTRIRCVPSGLTVPL